MARCELTHLARTPIDLDRATAQHEAYIRCLSDLGCRIHRLSSDASMPDAVFIEDTAVVVDELAVITRPGAASRRAETEAVAAALGGYRPTAAITAPGTLDGGDVLRIGRVLYVGAGQRSNAEGIAQLARLLSPRDYDVRATPTRDCLHLKTAATLAAPGLVVVNPDWVDPAAFNGMDCVAVDPAEPFAANVLRVGEVVIAAAAHPRTTARLRAAGVEVREVPMSELAKAEGGVTCCSIIIDDAGRRAR